jgi:anti-anti-sigma regulatory factor
MSTRRLRWSLDATGSTAVIEGDIDEFSELSALAATLTAAEVTLDCAGVKRLNSLGVRQWIQLMQSLDGKRVVLRRCSPAIVEQLNSIRGFGGKAKIASVMLPYTCESCNTLVQTELGLDGWKAGQPLPSGPTCPKCSSATEFDDLPDRYLGFVKYL